MLVRGPGRGAHSACRCSHPDLGSREARRQADGPGLLAQLPWAAGVGGVSAACQAAAGAQWPARPRSHHFLRVPSSRQSRAGDAKPCGDRGKWDPHAEPPMARQGAARRVPGAAPGACRCSECCRQRSPDTAPGPTSHTSCSGTRPFSPGAVRGRWSLQGGLTLGHRLWDAAQYVTPHQCPSLGCGRHCSRKGAHLPGTVKAIFRNTAQTPQGRGPVAQSATAPPPPRVCFSLSQVPSARRMAATDPGLASTSLPMQGRAPCCPGCPTVEGLWWPEAGGLSGRSVWHRVAGSLLQHRTQSVSPEAPPWGSHT